MATHENLMAAHVAYITKLEAEKTEWQRRCTELIAQKRQLRLELIRHRHALMEDRDDALDEPDEPEDEDVVVTTHGDDDDADVIVHGARAWRVF